MADIQESEKKEVKIKSTAAFRDLIILAAFVFFTLILSYFFGVFFIIVNYLQKHPDKIIYIDEVITALLTLSIGLVVFAWRRWRELKKETDERIKKQEEVLRLTATKAEVERIISKQLHSDMDQMKQDVREILYLLNNKNKKTPV